MNDMVWRIIKIIAITGGVVVALIGLRRIGWHAQSVHKRNEALRTASGYCRRGSRYCIRAQSDCSAIEEPVSFTVRVSPSSQQRMTRRGVLVRRPHARAVVLICHGFMCTKDDVRFLRGVLFQNYTTLSFDFRAHGELKSGQCCTFGLAEKEDVVGAVQFIRSQSDLRDKPLIVYGFSMGAVASLLAQAEHKNLFTAAIWDCPFDSTDEIIRRTLRHLNVSIAGYEFEVPGKSLLQRYAYNPRVQDFIKKALKTIACIDTSPVETQMARIDTVAAAKNITIPALFIVCARDSKAPVSAVTQVYRSVRGYKRLWITSGRAHFDSFFYNPEQYAYKVSCFIEKVLDGVAQTGALDERGKVVIDEQIDAPTRAECERCVRKIGVSGSWQ